MTNEQENIEDEDDGKPVMDYWNDWHKNGEYKFLKIPYCVLWIIMDAGTSFTEAKILFCICRQSFGYRRFKTNYLRLPDFEKNAFLTKSQVSKALKSLTNRGFISRGNRLNDTYKYRIKVEKYGIKMKPAKTRKDKKVTSNVGH